jgi:hypothetical protein
MEVGAGSGGGGGDGVTAVSTFVPQLIQNFASSGFSAWQVEQIMSILPYTKNVPIVKEKMLLSQSKLSVRRFVA